MKSLILLAIMCASAYATSSACLTAITSAEGWIATCGLPSATVAWLSQTTTFCANGTDAICTFANMQSNYDSVVSSCPLLPLDIMSKLAKLLAVSRAACFNGGQCMTNAITLIGVMQGLEAGQITPAQALTTVSQSCIPGCPNYLLSLGVAYSRFINDPNMTSLLLSSAMACANVSKDNCFMKLLDIKAAGKQKNWTKLASNVCHPCIRRLSMLVPFFNDPKLTAVFAALPDWRAVCQLPTNGTQIPCGQQVIQEATNLNLMQHCTPFTVNCIPDINTLIANVSCCVRSVLPFLNSTVVQTLEQSVNLPDACPIPKANKAKLLRLKLYLNNLNLTVLQGMWATYKAAIAQDIANNLGLLLSEVDVTAFAASNKRSTGQVEIDSTVVPSTTAYQVGDVQTSAETALAAGSLQLPSLNDGVVTSSPDGALVQSGSTQIDNGSASAAGSKLVSVVLMVVALFVAIF